MELANRTFKKEIDIFVRLAILQARNPPERLPSPGSEEIDMSNPELARRLREARELASVSQQAAADHVGIPRTAITQIEAGNRLVSTLELSKLAELYRRSISWFLADVQQHDDDVLVALHRLAPGLQEDDAIRFQVDRCVSLCREGVNLEKILGREERPVPPVYQEPAPNSAWEAVRQGHKVAEQERRRLGLGSSPLPDLAELMVDQGIWASGANLPGTMSGLFLHHPSIGMAILVNAQHPRARRRFSYAHEYAHALFDRDRVANVTTTDNRVERVEQRANAFASAFLLPAEGIDDELRQLGKGQPSRGDVLVFDAATGGSIEGQARSAPNSQTIGFQDVAYIAHRFGVSYEAATYRLKSLRRISQAESVKLLTSAMQDAGRDYLRALELFDDLEGTDTPQRGTRELRSRIAHLAIEAYRRGEISRGRLLDLSKALEIEGSQLFDLAEVARSA